MGGMSETDALREQVAKLTQERDSLAADFSAAARDALILKTALDNNIDPEQLARFAGQSPQEIDHAANRIRIGMEGGFNGGCAPSATPAKDDRTPDQIIREAAGGYDSDT